MRRWLYRLVVVVATFASADPALSAESSERRREVEFPVRIAVADFRVANWNLPGGIDISDMGKQLTEIVKDDLASLIQYSFVAEDSSSMPPKLSQDPDWDRMKDAGVDALVRGLIEIWAGNIAVSYYLWADRRKECGSQYRIRPDSLPNFGHVIADAVHQCLTGEPDRFAKLIDGR